MGKRFALAGLLVCSLACAGHFSAFSLNSSLALMERAEVIPLDMKDIVGDSHQLFIPVLTDIIEKKYKIEVAFTTFLEAGLWGYNTGDLILIEDSLSPNAKVATLIHELGHSLQPAELDGTNDGQVFAEALSILVCKEIGLDIHESSYAYLQRFYNRHTVLTRYRRELDQAAADLLKELK